MDTPLVSILIPAYKPRHFEIALTSALAQTYGAKEIIVSDDCPTEEIAAICARYPQVNYSRNPEKGPNTNLQRLTRMANGEYLKYLFDDDILHPLCVGRMVEALVREDAVKLVFSARDRIDADNRIVNQSRSIRAEGPIMRLPGQMLRRHCVTRFTNLIGEFTTVMFRRSDVVRPDGSTIYVSYHGDPIMGLTDIATFLQLCEKGDALYFADALSMFRVHGEANSASPQSPVYVAGLTEWALFAKHACEDPTFSHQERSECVRNGIERLGRWAERFPQVEPELRRLRALEEQLSAAQSAGVAGPAAT